MILGPWLAQHWIAPFSRPVERAAVDDHAAHRIAMSAEKFGQRMHHNIGAIIDRFAQIWSRQRVIDDIRHAGSPRDLRYRRHVGDDTAGIGNRFREDSLGLRADRSLKRRNVLWIGPDYIPIEIFEGVVELID